MTNSAYIHIPFCVSKCHYCDFLSFSGSTRDYAVYKSALIDEITLTDGLSEPDTVYIGGGTPSVLPPRFIADIIGALGALGTDAEVTLEANPGTVTADTLAQYRAMGVNRLSFGLQSVHDALLKQLGRIHVYADFERNYHAARRAGFDNISVDIMYSLPGQGLGAWRETLTTVIELAPEHISAYGLTIEDNTELGRRARAGELIQDETLDREMYALACELLPQNGYAQYEISNFAKPGYESRHNTKYWTRAEYIGFGLGAHSFAGGTRWRNTERMDEYNGRPQAIRRDITPLTRADAMAEFMFLGLRLTRGVSEAEFLDEFGCGLRAVYGERIRKLAGMGLLIEDAGRIRLSRRAVDVSNIVLAEFV